jgi:hypothetical protein
MRVCIFGSRNLKDASRLEDAMNAAAWAGIVPTAVASGTEPTGVDRMGEQWAAARGIPVVPFRPDWDDVEAPGAIVKFRTDGAPYNAKAGFDRNEEMGEWAEAGVCLWDGVSPGTKNMIDIFRRLGKPVHIEPAVRPTGGLFDELE